MLQDRGIPVIDADTIAHDILEPGLAAFAQVVATFGKQVLTEAGTINRPMLREMVFADPKKRRQLNSITHPKIAWEIFRQLVYHRFLHGQAIVILDAPLLFESGLQRICRRVIVVTTAVETQVDRIRTRDNVTEESAMNVIQCQMPANKKLKLADDIIDNSSDLGALETQVHLVADRLSNQDRIF